MHSDTSPNPSSFHHVPVMADSLIACLKPQDNELYLDATFGQGGHSRAILKSAKCHLIASDRDIISENASNSLQQEAIQKKYQGKFSRFFLSRFANIEETLAQQNISQLDGIIADLGLSSPQIDQPSRGFSFKNDGPLDMRMGNNKFSAKQLIYSSSEKELYSIIKFLGEEKYAKRISKAITLAKKQGEIDSTSQLALIVKNSVPNKSQQKINPATKTFQALRIAVNSELNELKALLNSALNLLKPEGRIVIISFHSLEDRIVKQFFSRYSQSTPNNSRYMPPQAQILPLLSLPTKKPIFPSESEISANPRARSARMRCAVRTKYLTS